MTAPLSFLGYSLSVSLFSTELLVFLNKAVVVLPDAASNQYFHRYNDPRGSP